MAFDRNTPRLGVRLVWPYEIPSSAAVWWKWRSPPRATNSALVASRYTSELCPPANKCSRRRRLCWAKLCWLVLNTRVSSPLPSLGSHADLAYRQKVNMQIFLTSSHNPPTHESYSVVCRSVAVQSEGRMQFCIESRPPGRDKDRKNRKVSKKSCCRSG